MAKYTGLFGYKILSGEYGFSKMTDLALRKSNAIVQSVIMAESARDLILTVKRLDKLSDLLCSVIDTAQLIQFVHPDELIRGDAHNAFKKLSNYLNGLNTNEQLYSVSNIFQEKFFFISNERNLKD